MKGKFREREERTEQQLNYLKTAAGSVPYIAQNHKVFFLMGLAGLLSLKRGQGVEAASPDLRGAADGPFQLDSDLRQGQRSLEGDAVYGALSRKLVKPVASADDHGGALC
jgi:hypothetical protein